MRSRQRKNLHLCWALVLIIIAFFHQFTEGQPQVYFKASQLPAKSLPRIGRRSDLDPYQGVDVWNDVFGYDNSNGVNNYNAHPDSILLWRKIMGDSMYPEDFPLSSGFYKVKEK